MKLIPLGMLIGLLLITGCTNGRPPEYSVSNPFALPDGSGGVIVSYQVNNDNKSNTFVQRISSDGNWGEAGIDLGLGSAGFTSALSGSASVLNDHAGNATVVYYSDNNLWVRKLDTEGHPVAEGAASKRVTPEGIPVPADFRAVDNSLGEIIVAWKSNQDYLKITKLDGIETSYSTSIATPGIDQFDVVSDSSGNFFVIWKDNPSYMEGKIFIQKLDSGGQVAWPSEALLLSGVPDPAAVTGEFIRQIISDNAGGAIVIWINFIKGEQSDGFNLYAQRISTTGKFLWNTGGLAIGNQSELLRSQTEPSILNDGTGGAIIFWQEGHTILAQRIDSEGNALWTENGIEVVKPAGYNVVYYNAASDGSGGSALVWNQGKQLYSQRLNIYGRKQWADAGIMVSSIPAYWASYAAPARISSAGDDGYFISWASGTNIQDRTSSYIQKIFANGVLLWGEDGLKLSP